MLPASSKMSTLNQNSSKMVTDVSCIAKYAQCLNIKLPLFSLRNEKMNDENMSISTKEV